MRLRGVIARLRQAGASLRGVPTVGPGPAIVGIAPPLGSTITALTRTSATFTTAGNGSTAAAAAATSTLTVARRNSTLEVAQP